MLPIDEAWLRRFGGECPCDGPYLKLTPEAHRTDGFFTAILERVG